MKPTRWQIVIANGTPSMTLVLGYSARKTKRALTEAMLVNGHMIADLANLPEDNSAGFEWSSKTKSWNHGNWEIRFSGLTERDVKGR